MRLGGTAPHAPAQGPVLAVGVQRWIPKLPSARARGADRWGPAGLARTVFRVTGTWALTRAVGALGGWGGGDYNTEEDQPEINRT